VQKRLVSTVVLGVIAALSVAALALGAALDSYKVSAALKPTGEVPAAKAPAAAKGTFTGKYVENAKGAVLTWKLSFSGLSGAAAAAHIHKGKAGVAGPVVVPLCGPCSSGMTGKTNITKALIAALESGGAYVNVHTAKNPGGEIRAQVKVSK
jgi:hypothetical protein